MQTNIVDPENIQTIANLLSNKESSQFSLEKTNQPNIFTINPKYNPQFVKIENSHINFLKMVILMI